MLYDTTFLSFCRKLYNVVLVWPPHATLLYSLLLARGQWKQFSRHISLLTGRTEIKKLFSLQTSSVIFLQSLPWLCFLMFLTCVRLLVLQSFTSFTIFSSDEESEVEGSFCDGEGEFSLFRIFLKECCIVLYEMLHSFGHPSVKHD